jgi:uncharacterized protein
MKTYSPTSLVQFWDNDFCAWLERFHLARPDQLVKEAVSDETALLFRKGMAHEKRLLEQFQTDDLGVVDLTGLKAEATLSAMQAGHHRIYQAPMTKVPFSGIADLLLRVETPSELGEFSYEVADIKLSRHAHPKHILQLCCYAEILESL